MLKVSFFTWLYDVAMNKLRNVNSPLILLLAMSLSGLQALGAPCVAPSAPAVCDIGMAPGDCGDGDLLARCCCLVDDVESASIPLAVVAESEPGFNSLPLVVQRSVADSLAHSVVPLSREAHASKHYPQRFQLYSSFLI